jgi:hypothetical protein
MLNAQTNTKASHAKGCLRLKRGEGKTAVKLLKLVEVAMGCLAHVT